MVLRLSKILKMLNIGIQTAQSIQTLGDGSFLFD